MPNLTRRLFLKGAAGLAAVAPVVAVLGGRARETIAELLARNVKRTERRVKSDIRELVFGGDDTFATYSGYDVPLIQPQDLVSTPEFKWKTYHAGYTVDDHV